MKTDKFVDAYIKIINESYSMVGPDTSDVNLSVKNDFNAKIDAPKTDAPKTNDISDVDTSDEKPIKSARKRKDAPYYEENAPYYEALKNFKENYKIKLSYYTPENSSDQGPKEELEINDINELERFYVHRYHESFEKYYRSMPHAVRMMDSKYRADQLGNENRPNIDVCKISKEFINKWGSEDTIVTDNLWNFEIELKPWFEQHAEELEQLPVDKDIEIWWYVPYHYNADHQLLYTIKVRVLKKQ